MAIDNRKSRLHAKRVHWHNVHRMFDEFSLELSLQNVIRRILLCHEPLRLYPREFHRYTVIQFIGDRVSCVCYCKKKKKEEKRNWDRVIAIDESMITPINRDSFYLIIGKNIDWSMRDEILIIFYFLFLRENNYLRWW